jgi:hypothetical protein
MTAKRVRFETAHRGHVAIEWTREGLEVVIGDGIAADTDGYEVKLDEVCTFCRVGKGCEKAKFAPPAPAGFARRGAKAKPGGVDEMDPLNRRAK